MTTDKPTSSGSQSRRWPWLAAVIAVLLLVVTALVVVLRSDQTGPAAPSPVTPGATTTSPPAAPVSLPWMSGRQMLYPFDDVAAARAWQQEYRQGGHSPWHRDAVLTAQSFTQGYLGYQNINRVVSQRVFGLWAWVGVGYDLPNGKIATAAVIHLVKLDMGADGPWEVVGTTDVAQLTLTQPAYGSTVTSPVTAGGRITGVDESLRILVRSGGIDRAGEKSGIPAGGTDSWWSASVNFQAPGGTVLTIAVSSGGHTQAVERFAVTGLRAGPLP